GAGGPMESRGTWYGLLGIVGAVTLVGCTGELSDDLSTSEESLRARCAVQPNPVAPGHDYMVLGTKFEKKRRRLSVVIDDPSGQSTHEVTTAKKGFSLSLSAPNVTGPGHVSIYLPTERRRRGKIERKLRLITECAFQINDGSTRDAGQTRDGGQTRDDAGQTRDGGQTRDDAGQTRDDAGQTRDDAGST